MAVDGSEVRRLTNEFKSSPGFKVHNEINNNKRSLRIVSRNRDELLHTISAVKRPVVAGPGQSSADNPSLALAYEELARRLEGYLSSVHDLIDYTRAYCRKTYEKTEHAREIQSELDKRFIFEPDYKLAEGLCLVSAHVDSLQAPAGPPQEGDDSRYRLRVKELLTWSEWNENQRRLLESMKDDIDVQEFSERYFKKVELFYSWLWKRQSEIHAEELREAEVLRLRAKDAYDKLFPPKP